MKKYSREWKEKEKKWVEKHTHSNGEPYWSIHYIQTGEEYSNGEYSKFESAKEDLKKYDVSE